MKSLKEHVLQTKNRLYILLYFPMYLLCFFLLENRNIPLSEYMIVHTKWDDMIPFCEYFVIPYFFWFVYMGIGLVIAYLEKDGRNYYLTCLNLFTGMTVFLVVSALIPNRDLLRPEVFPRDNLCSTLVGFLYKIDTATNLFPSIHVFNSIAIHTCICKCQRFQDRPRYKWASFVVMCSIILATLFLKQHSVFDVVTGMLMSAVLYVFIYHVVDHQILTAMEKYDKNMILSE